MALFRNTEDFVRVYPALESVSWELLRPIVDTVEVADLGPQVLGSELYAALDSAFAQVPAEVTTPEPEDPAMKALFHMVRPYIAYKAAYEAARKLNTLFTSGGLQQVEVEKRAAMWAARERRASDLSDAYSRLNVLIDFLIAKESTTYPTWSTSPIRREIRESMVPTMRTAGRFIRLHGPWMLHQLRPAMRDVQTGPVLSILGQSTYDTLLTNIHTVGHTFSTTDNARLDQIVPAILHGALADQIVPLGLIIDQNGVYSWQVSSGGGQLSGGEKPAEAERINGLIRYHQAKSRHHIDALSRLVNPETSSGDRRVSSSRNSTFF